MQQNIWQKDVMDLKNIPNITEQIYIVESKTQPEVFK